MVELGWAEPARRLAEDGSEPEAHRQAADDDQDDGNGEGANHARDGSSRRSASVSRASARSRPSAAMTANSGGLTVLPGERHAQGHEERARFPVVAGAHLVEDFFEPLG